MKDWKNRKLISKFHRIAMSSDIKRVLMSLPITNLEESQVGNYVYSGHGKLLVGSSYTPASVRVRVVDGVANLVVRAPAAGINIACPLSVEAVTNAVTKAVARSLN